MRYFLTRKVNLLNRSTMVPTPHYWQSQFKKCTIDLTYILTCLRMFSTAHWKWSLYLSRSSTTPLQNSVSTLRSIIGRPSSEEGSHPGRQGAPNSLSSYCTQRMNEASMDSAATYEYSISIDERGGHNNIVWLCISNKKQGAGSRGWCPLAQKQGAAPGAGAPLAQKHGAPGAGAPTCAEEL